MTAASSSSVAASAVVASAASVAELLACVNQGLALVHFQLNFWQSASKSYEQSKAKQIMDQSQARISLFRACDWPTLCILCSQHFGALCHNKNFLSIEIL